MQYDQPAEQKRLSPDAGANSKVRDWVSSSNPNRTSQDSTNRPARNVEMRPLALDAQGASLIESSRLNRL